MQHTLKKVHWWVARGLIYGNDAATPQITLPEKKCSIFTLQWFIVFDLVVQFAHLIGWFVLTLRAVHTYKIQDVLNKIRPQGTHMIFITFPSRQNTATSKYTLNKVHWTPMLDLRKRYGNSTNKGFRTKVLIFTLQCGFIVFDLGVQFAHLIGWFVLETCKTLRAVHTYEIFKMSSTKYGHLKIFHRFNSFSFFQSSHTVSIRNGKGIIKNVWHIKTSMYSNRKLQV